MGRLWPGRIEAACAVVPHLQVGDIRASIRAAVHARRWGGPFHPNAGVSMIGPWGEAHSCAISPARSRTYSPDRDGSEHENQSAFPYR